MGETVNKFLTCSACKQGEYRNNWFEVQYSQDTRMNVSILACLHCGTLRIDCDELIKAYKDSEDYRNSILGE